MVANNQFSRRETARDHTLTRTFDVARGGQTLERVPRPLVAAAKPIAEDPYRNLGTIAARLRNLFLRLVAGYVQYLNLSSLLGKLHAGLLRQRLQYIPMQFLPVRGLQLIQRNRVF